MAVSEAARHDLYTGLLELLGERRAETLISALSGHDLGAVATKADAAVIESRLDGLDVRLGRVEDALPAMSTRLDRLTYALVAGLVAIGGRGRRDHQPVGHTPRRPANV